MLVREPTRIFPRNHLDLSWRPSLPAPPNDSVCLVMCISDSEPETAMVTMGYYDNGWTVDLDDEDFGIAAWMPVPDPPSCSCTRGSEN